MNRKVLKFVRGSLLTFFLFLIFPGAAQMIKAEELTAPVIKAVYNCGYGARIDFYPVENAEGYRLWRKSGVDGSWVFVTSHPRTEAGMMIFRDRKTMITGEYYFYKVTAFNASSEKDSAVSRTYYLPRFSLLSATTRTGEDAASPNALLKWPFQEKADGFQVQYTINGAAGFTNANSSIFNVYEGTATGTYFDGLRYDTVYSVRVRSFAKRDGVTYYSEYSPVGAVKTAQQTIEISSVSLSLSAMTLPLGSSKKLTAAIYPQNVNVPRTVTWESSDPSVASVSKGTVKGNSPGTAVIKASAGKVSTSCRVTVSALNAREMALQIYRKYLSRESIDIGEGEIVPSSMVRFAFCYVDNNIIPELVLEFDGRIRIFTVYSGKMVLLAHRDSRKIQRFFYFEKTGIYGVMAGKAPDTNATWTYYRLENGKNNGAEDVVLYCKRFAGPLGWNHWESGVFFHGYMEGSFTESGFLSLRKQITKGKPAITLSPAANTEENRNRPFE